jgi:hypothetical protein
MNTRTEEQNLPLILCSEHGPGKGWCHCGCPNKNLRYVPPVPVNTKYVIYDDRIGEFLVEKEGRDGLVEDERRIPGLGKDRRV